jgi:hypothetical protein
MEPRPAARASRAHHPSVPSARAAVRPSKILPSVAIPRDTSDFELTVGERTVRLTNLQKVFWAERGITKRDLLQYYADVAAPSRTRRAMSSISPWFRTWCPCCGS